MIPLARLTVWRLIRRSQQSKSWQRRKPEPRLHLDIEKGMKDECY
jgi:hypothetical protein